MRLQTMFSRHAPESDIDDSHPTGCFYPAARLLRFAGNDNTHGISVVIARSAQRDEAISATRAGASVRTRDHAFHCTLMPDSRMTAPHLSISDFKYIVKPSGVCCSGGGTSMP